MKCTPFQSKGAYHLSEVGVWMGIHQYWLKGKENIKCELNCFPEHVKRVQRIISIFLSPVCLLFSLLRVASVLGFAAFMQSTYSEEVSMLILLILFWGHFLEGVW